jgi:hypothetical protein
LDWVFFHYGPYALELVDTLEQMEGSELSVQPWHDSTLYRGAPGLLMVRAEFPTSAAPSTT